MSDYSGLFQYDELKIYFGDDYVVNDYITIKQPTVGDIKEFGEIEYWQMVYTLCAIPSDMKSTLWDKYEIDWNKISDFDLFIMLTRSMKPEVTGIILGDLDLSEFDVYKDTETNENILVTPDRQKVIDSFLYSNVIGYIRKVNGLTVKREIARDKFTKSILLDEDRDRIKSLKDKPYESSLRKLISGVRRFPGFNYSKEEILDMGIYEFMDAVKGSQIYVASTALLQGAYSGMMDTSKINKNEFDWMRQD